MTKKVEEKEEKNKFFFSHNKNSKDTSMKIRQIHDNLPEQILSAILMKKPKNQT